MSDRHVLEHAYVAYSRVVVCWREGVRRNEEHSWKGSLLVLALRQHQAEWPVEGRRV